jgi:DNA-binding XRE family transcriptional regulator
MDLRWDRLGEELQAARVAASYTQEDMARELGVSRASIQKIERGDSFRRVTPTMRAFAQRLGWSENSIERVLEGGTPALADTPAARDRKTAAGVSAEATGLPLRIVDELEDEGDLLDSVVLPLGDDARMVVVVKGKPGASPEEIRRNLEAWRKAQRHLQSVGDDESGDVANEA